MLATKNGHENVVRYLVDHGANVHRQKVVSIFIHANVKTHALEQMELLLF